MPIRFFCKVLALALAAYLGHLTAPTKIQTVTINSPPLVVMPTANRGVEIQPGLRWINIEAEVPIFQVDNEITLLSILNERPENGFFMGAYTPQSEAIYVLGTWTMETETFGHELIHYLEHACPESAWKIRRAYHRLCSPKCRMDSMDLIPDLAEPVLFGPPSATLNIVVGP